MSWPRAACGACISWLLLCLLALAVTPAGVPARGAVAAGIGPLGGTPPVTGVATDAATIAAPGAGPPVSQASPGPQVSIRPDAGPPQTVATLTGSGFAAGERVVVIYTDARNTVAGVRPIGSATADGNGAIASVEVTIPPSASPGSLGMLSLIGNRCAAGQGCVTGSDRAQAEASLPFAVTPLASAITVDRAVVPAGGTIVVGGSGYEPGTAVTLALIAPGGVLMPLASVPITTTVTGILGPVSVSIPPSIAPGIAALDAVDGAGNVAGVPLTILDPSGTVASGVTIEPARAALGTFIRFTAAGLPLNGLVSLTLTGAAGSSVPIEVYPLADAAAPFSQPLGNAVATLTADSLGVVRGGFVLPRIGGVTLGGTPGLGGDGNGGTMVTLELQAAGTAGDRGHGALLLVAGAKIQTFPPVAVPGHPYTTVGSGFVAGESVQVTALDESGTLSQVGQAVAADCQSGTVPFGQAAATQPTPSAPCVSGTFVLSAIAPTPPASAGGGAAGTPAAGFRLSAIGQTSGLYAGARLVTTTAPTLTLRPYVVAPGGSVEVQGHAFAANAALIVRAGGASASTPTSGASKPDTSGGGSATAVGSCPDNSGASCAARIPASVPVQTDTSGFFSVRLAVPLGTGTGPITIVAGSDSSGAGMDTASTVLTVNTQHALLSVTPHSAMPQQVITVRGSGFASGEAVDLFLAQPGALGLSAAGQGGDSAPAPLPDTTLSVTADAFGAISASYPLPNTIAPGSYIVGARGETSDIRALNALVIGGGPTATPTATCVPRTCVAPTPIAPRPTATPTPCVANGHAATKQGTSCGTTSGGGSAESVAYFAGGSTAQDTVTVLGGGGQAAVRYSAATRQDLHLTNGGDQQVSVVIAYLLYAVTPPVLPPASRGSTASGQFASLTTIWPALWLPRGGGAFQLSRRRALTLMPHSTQVRSINGDIGNGHLVSIIVRFSVGSAPQGFSLASARASGTSAMGARDSGSGAGALARVVVTLVTHRILQVAGLQGGHLPRLGSRICSGSQPCALTLDGGSTAGTILPDGAVASASPAPNYSTVFAEGWIRGAGNPPAGTAATVPLEGSTSLTFFNPQGSAITAQIRFLSPSGPLGVRARVNLVPFGRQTIGVDGLLGDLCPNAHGIPTLACLPGTPARARARPLAAMGLSMVVTAPEPLVVERSLFWGETVSAASPLPGTGGFDQAAGGAAPGARAGTPTSQYISYASTLGGDRATLTLANAGTGVAAVRIDAYTNTGVRVVVGGGAAIRLRPQSRIAIALGCTDQHSVRCSLPAGAYTIAIASSTPIGAELTQYAGGAGAGAVIAASDGQAGQADGGWRGSNGYTLPTCAPAPCRNGGGIMLRVFNPAGTRLVARISTIQSNGMDGVVAYQIGPHATSQLLLPISGIGGVGRASPTGGSGQGDAVAAVVECGGPCVAAAIQGMPGGIRLHAGSGSPQAGRGASSEVLAGILQ